MSLLNRAKTQVSALQIAVTMLNTANKAKQNGSSNFGTLWVAYTDYLSVNGLRHDDVVNALSGMYIQV